MGKRGLSRAKDGLGGAAKLLVVVASSLHLTACGSIGNTPISLFDAKAQRQAAPTDGSTALQQATE